MTKLGAYARGTNSWAVCDYCGQVWPYRQMRNQWYQIDNLQQKVILTQWRVCPEDFDPDVYIKIIKSDPQALKFPRVDNRDAPPNPPYPTSPPTLAPIIGGSLPQTDYYAVISYQFAWGEGPGSTTSNLTVGSGYLLQITSPPPYDILGSPIAPSSVASSSIGWNVYVGTSPTALYRQTTSPIPFQFNGSTAVSTYWTEPTTGIVESIYTPQPLFDGNGYIWDTVMTNTWTPTKPGMWSQWVPLTGTFSYANGIVTVSTVPKNNYNVGNTILIEDTGDIAYQGIFTITSVSSDYTFTYIPNQMPQLLSTNGQSTRLIESTADY